MFTFLLSLLNITWYKAAKYKVKHPDNDQFKHLGAYMQRIVLGLSTRGDTKFR